MARAGRGPGRRPAEFELRTPAARRHGGRHGRGARGLELQLPRRPQRRPAGSLRAPRGWRRGRGRHARVLPSGRGGLAGARRGEHRDPARPRRRGGVAGRAQRGPSVRMGEPRTPARLPPERTRTSASRPLRGGARRLRAGLRAHDSGRAGSLPGSGRAPGVGRRARRAGLLAHAGSDPRHRGERARGRALRPRGVRLPPVQLARGRCVAGVAPLRPAAVAAGLRDRVGDPDGVLGLRTGAGHHLPSSHDVGERRPDSGVRGVSGRPSGRVPAPVRDPGTGELLASGPGGPLPGTHARVERGGIPLPSPDRTRAFVV